MYLPSNPTCKAQNGITLLMHHETRTQLSCNVSGHLRGYRIIAESALTLFFELESMSRMARRTVTIVVTIKQFFQSARETSVLLGNIEICTMYVIHASSACWESVIYDFFLSLK